MTKVSLVNIDNLLLDWSSQGRYSSEYLGSPFTYRLGTEPKYFSVLTKICL